MDGAERAIRVAIIGGGCAGVTAAFELSRPEHHGRYDVTLYQQGWRLGGKGATGRGPAARIEEHGLHMWLGFYENAFRLMRECYAELGRDPARCPIADWRDAFVPEPVVGLADRNDHGSWVKWTACFPANAGLPGDPLERENPFTLGNYLARALELLETLLLDLECHDAGPRHTAPAATTAGERQSRDHQSRDHQSRDHQSRNHQSRDHQSRNHQLRDHQSHDNPARLADGRRADLGALERLVRYGAIGTVAGMLEGIKLLQLMLPQVAPWAGTRLVNVLNAFAGGARARFEALVESDDEARLKWHIIDLVLAIMTGFVRHRLLLDPRGLDAIDDYECRDWLRQNGASEASLNSAFVRGLYDLALAYEDGDKARPALAAGQAIRGAMRMFFSFRGQLFWKMSAGMGDTVFAPYYEVLARRGVCFRFFHRLRDLRVDSDDDGADYVAALEFDVQAKCRDGQPYKPLIDVGGLPCWPAAPDFAQLADGDALRAAGVDFESHWDTTAAARFTARVGEDFDLAVLAVGGGAVPGISGELQQRSPAWRQAMDNLHTVATQAFQIWMTADMATLGWPHGALTLSAFSPPFDTWADMHEVVRTERWPEPPAALAYFCGVLPDPAVAPADHDEDYPARRRREVHDNAVRFLNERAGELWPGAIGDGGFRWELLATPDADDSRAPPADVTRFATQFWTANVNPSDRYVLALPGTLAARLSPLDRSFDNFTVAGDWTACGFTEGCVEAAVMSGRLAAHAISGSPPLADIIGYDHP